MMKKKILFVFILFAGSLISTSCEKMKMKPKDHHYHNDRELWKEIPTGTVDGWHRGHSQMFNRWGAQKAF